MPKLLIAHYKFFVVYLSLLLLLAEMEEWNKIVVEHCKAICASIKNSYHNYIICGKVY